MYWKIYLSGLEKVGMEPGIAQQLIVSTFNLIFTSPPVSESAKNSMEKCQICKSPISLYRGRIVLFVLNAPSIEKEEDDINRV